VSLVSHVFVRTQVRMRSVAFCVLAFAACALAANTGYAHLDGELIPTSPSVVISGTEFTLNRDGDKLSFSEGGPQSLQASASTPAAAAQADNPYIVHANKWDAEMLNTRAIARASNGISDLLKSVDTKIPEYIHKALRDYPDDDGVQHQQATSSIVPQAQAPPPNPMQGADQEDGAVDEFVDSFLEVAATRLTPLQRIRAATREKIRQNAIQASIQLELASDASPAKGIERELNDELLSLNSDPQLKEWEEEAQWKQQRSDVHDTLGSSDDLLSSINNRYRHAADQE